MNKRVTAKIIIFLLLLAAIGILSVRFLSKEDLWICQNGEWIKHGNPSSPKPEAFCGRNNPTPERDGLTEGSNENAGEMNKSEATVVDSDIIVNQPKANGAIDSPLEIDGKAKGSWFFEGTFPVKILGNDGQVIAQSSAKALGEWMTSDMVPFRAIIDFSVPKETEAVLVLSQDDPSGQGNVKDVKIPVTLGKTVGMRIKLYFSSLYFDPSSSNCEKVYEVERVIPKTQSVAKATIEELLSGITEEEKDGGYFTNINDNVTVQKISIIGGTARIDFSKNIEEGVGGSCRTSAIRAQITETLKQFPTVKNVVISVGGKTEGILQP